MNETAEAKTNETKTAGICGNTKEIIINFNVYENGVECQSVSSVVMPTIAHVIQISGAAAISIEAAILRFIYNRVTPDTNFYFEPTRRMIEIRLVQQRYDFDAGKYVVDAIKHVFMAEPKRANAGEIAPASPLNAYVDYTIDYWKTVVNGETLLEIDQHNGICLINKRKYAVVGDIKIG